MKTHIICEDSVSGFIFWKAINKHIFNNICTIHSAGGVTNIISKVDELIDYGSIQSGDRVILVFDRGKIKLGDLEHLVLNHKI